MQVTGVGSMLNVHFQRGTIRRAQDTWLDGEAAQRRDDVQKLFHLDMLGMGQYLARRGYATLSLPMTDKDHDAFAGALDEFLSLRGSLIG